MSESQFSNRVRIRSCAVIVKDSSILLAKIDALTRTEPIWMPPGGGVELGESLEQALVREVKEETGLLVQKKELLWIHEFIEDPFHAIEFYFRCKITGGSLKKGVDPELNANDQMLLDMAFVPFKKAQSLSLKPDFIKDFCQWDGRFPQQAQHVISE